MAERRKRDVVRRLLGRLPAPPEAGRGSRRGSSNVRTEEGRDRYIDFGPPAPPDEAPTPTALRNFSLPLRANPSNPSIPVFARPQTPDEERRALAALPPHKQQRDVWQSLRDAPPRPFTVDEHMKRYRKAEPEHQPGRMGWEPWKEGDAATDAYNGETHETPPLREDYVYRDPFIPVGRTKVDQATREDGRIPDSLEVARKRLARERPRNSPDMSFEESPKPPAPPSSTHSHRHSRTASQALQPQQNNQPQAVFNRLRQEEPYRPFSLEEKMGRMELGEGDEGFEPWDKKVMHPQVLAYHAEGPPAEQGKGVYNPYAPQTRNEDDAHLLSVLNIPDGTPHRLQVGLNTLVAKERQKRHEEKQQYNRRTRGKQFDKDEEEREQGRR